MRKRELREWWEQEKRSIDLKTSKDKILYVSMMGFMIILIGLGLFKLIQ